MTPFSYADAPVEVAPAVADSHRSVWDELRRCGTWWTAAERLTVAGRARAVLAQRHLPPWSRPLDAVADLPPAAATVVDQVASAPGSIDRAWAEARVAELGDGPYVELVGVTATVAMVDVFAVAAGVAPEPLPGPDDEPGEPSRGRPSGMGDIGAYVVVTDPFEYANVARALSLVPAVNRLFRTASVPMYSAPGMEDLVWSTPLQRPQVELVASRVAAMNECFY
ncbi:MAG: hypothetical protein ACFCVK_05105 [Acidimicrobiales bacterium]